MECSKPGAIRSEELLAYLAGEKVRPAVKQHLASCRYCSSQLATYRRMERTLMKQLYRWDCPSNQILGEYQLGLLDKNLAAQVKHHLSMCMRCTAEVATLNAFLAGDPMLVERAAPQHSVSASGPTRNNHHSIQGTKEVLDALRDQASTGLRRIVATLLPLQPSLAREHRDAQVLRPRRYTAEDVSIAIQLARTVGRGDGLQLSGLVTHKGVALGALQGTPVRLSSQAQAMYTQAIDELGNFVFPAVAPATYTLEVQLPDRIIAIEPLIVSTQD